MIIGSIRRHACDPRASADGLPGGVTCYGDYGSNQDTVAATAP